MNLTMSTGEIAKSVQHSPDPVNKIWTLSQELKCEPDEIVNILKEGHINLSALGIANRTKFWDREKAVELFRQGVPYTRIASIVGVSKETLKYYLKKIGVFEDSIAAKNCGGNAKKQRKKKAPTLPTTTPSSVIESSTPTSTASDDTEPWYGDLPERLRMFLDNVRPCDSAETIKLAKQYAIALLDQSFSEVFNRDQ